MTTKMTEEHKKLRKLVREFLRAISDVPLRAVDCDQSRTYKLMEKLEKASGYKS